MKKQLLAIFIIIFSIPGCGGGSRGAVVPAPVPTPAPVPGTIINTIPYPPGISWIGDITYDIASKTIWATAGNVVTLSSLIKMDANGNVIKTIPITNFFINHGSEITFDGTSLWITAFGTSNGIIQSKIFNVDLQGNVLATIACPATQGGGYCEGIAWDNAAQTLWSLASDNKSLTQYMRNGAVVAQYTNVLPTVPLSSLGIHILFDSPSSRLILLVNRKITPVNPFTGQPSASVSGYVSTTSGWDGSHFWQADNTALVINVLVSGL